MPLRPDLPETCPPARDVDIPQNVGRLLYGVVPTQSDFIDWIDEPGNGNRQVKISECQKKSMSVFDIDSSYLLDVFRKVPKMRMKYKYYAVIAVELDSGILAKTSGPGHISWWKCRAWNPIVKILNVVEL